MINLGNYPQIKVLTESSSEITYAKDALFDLYQEERRVSGRLVIEHCIEAAEITSYFTLNPDYLVTAMYHDLREDKRLSFKEVMAISGKNGHRIAQMVTTLSKRPDIQGREERNREYLRRLSSAISAGDRGIGLVKIADRISNLKDLNSLAPEKQTAIARQTLCFFVPIANILGLTVLSWEMTSLNLPYINPKSDGGA